MNIQKLTWILERTLYYTLLFLTLAAVIYSFANDYPIGGLISLILMMAVIHKGFANITIPANSVAVKDNNVVFLVPEKSVMKRFDFVSRGQHIVTLPVYGVFDRSYRLEFFVPEGEKVASCQLTLRLGYGTEREMLQCAHDTFIRHESRFADEVRNRLLQAAAGVSFEQISQRKDSTEEYLEPVVAKLNAGLAPIGIEIKEASSSFESGKVLVRV